MLSNRVDWRIFLFELKYPALGYKNSRQLIQTIILLLISDQLWPIYSRTLIQTFKPSYHLELLSSLLIGLHSDIDQLYTWNIPGKIPLQHHPSSTHNPGINMKQSSPAPVFHAPPTSLRADTMDSRVWCLQQSYHLEVHGLSEPWTCDHWHRNRQ